jgi:hypothetical protein
MRIALIALALTTLTSVLLVEVCAASSVTGYADTGFTQANKRACCEAAVLAAQRSGAAACEERGGYPVLSGSSARGRCDWQTQRMRSGRSVYRCTATASVRCR